MRPDPALVHEFAPTGELRAAINLGNPVLAQSHTARERPAGVTIDLARRFGELLGVPVQLLPFETPGASAAAIASGKADIGFLAVDPKRAESIHFTAPYVQIEGCYLVRDASPLQHNDEVDQPGRRIVAGAGSAYALYLARELRHAQLVEVPFDNACAADALLADPALDAAAGVRQQLLADLARVPGVRLLPGAFMAIHQAMAMPRGRSAAAMDLLESFLAQQRASGDVRDALARHGMEGVTALP